MSDRLLFIVKSREADWGGYGAGGSASSSGLGNSVQFIVDMLRALNVDASLVEVQDNNDIDRVVTDVLPTHVIVEAFWVVPEKFDVLKKLHPSVAWIVRNHSEVPFLASEGIAFGWIAGYLQRGVEVMCNAPRALYDLRSVAMAYGISDRMVTYGPNYYPVHAVAPVPRAKATVSEIDVGCFGAIRPLKNQMTQALAALEFARQARCRLRFHINATRIEGNGDPTLKNLRALFAATSGHELVEHDWLPHQAFLILLSQMDIALQVSFSETFNIVAADAAVVGVPVVVSNELPWIGGYAHATPTDTRSIVNAMLRIWNSADGSAAQVRRQTRDLVEYCTRTEDVWRSRFVPQPVI